MSANGSFSCQSTDKPGSFHKVSAACSRFFLNRYVWLALFCLACAISFTGREVIGAVFFVGIICFTLIYCEDIMASMLPFMLLCTFVTNCYDSFQTFLPYIWIAGPVIFAIVFHFIVFRKKIQIGSTFWGLVAVAVAITFGGIGFISASEYFKPGVLYYTAFLGVGMVVAYLLMKSQLCVPRSYNVSEKFLSVLYVSGLFACCMVLFFATENWSVIRTELRIPDWQPSNNLSTFLMFAMPCPFFFVRKNVFHLVSPFLMYLSIVLTGSRAGLILGAIELVACFVIAAFWDKPRRFYYVCFVIFFAAVAYVSGEQILQFSTHKTLKDLVSQDEARYQLILRALDLFKENPIFGHGLGYVGNSDLYSPVAGAMHWYHMMIPQVVGSLGLCGILAYGFQLVLQARVTLLPMKTASEEQRGRILTLASSYVGIFLMSQLNPGLFCPIPYTVLSVMIFALIDGDRGCDFLKNLKKKKVDSLK